MLFLFIYLLYLLGKGVHANGIDVAVIGAAGSSILNAEAAVLKGFA